MTEPMPPDAGNYADDVGPGGPHHSERAVERERERAGQIQSEQQRVGPHARCLPRPPMSRSTDWTATGPPFPAAIDQPGEVA